MKWFRCSEGLSLDLLATRGGSKDRKRPLQSSDQKDLSSAIKMESTGLSTMQLRQQMPALANKTYFN